MTTAIHLHLQSTERISKKYGLKLQDYKKFSFRF